MKHNIEKTLKAAAIQSGRTAYRLAKETGLSPRAIAWFMQGHRTLRLDSAAKLAAALNLELTPANTPGKVER